MIEQVILFDDAAWRLHLLPLVATRPVSDLRTGILTIREKWAYWIGSTGELHYQTTTALTEAYGSSSDKSGSALVIRGNVLPNEHLVSTLSQLQSGEVLMDEDVWVAYRVPDISRWDPACVPQGTAVAYHESKLRYIRFPEDIFLQNSDQIVADLDLISRGQSWGPLPQGNVCVGTHHYIGSDVSFYGVTLDTTSGPIYVGPGALLEPGCYIKGPVAICSQARVKVGARLYPNVTIGPGSTVGGEINNTVIWGYSAKGHDGYLGCAVLGEGCNLGAGTCNSNLRNDWKTVSMYDYATQNPRDTELLKCGLILGDYVMTAIQTTFSTGTVVGVGAQITLSRVVPRFVPDFMWMTDQVQTNYDIQKFQDMVVRKGHHQKRSANAEESRIFAKHYKATDHLRIRFIQHLIK